MGSVAISSQAARHTACLALSLAIGLCLPARATDATEVDQREVQYRARFSSLLTSHALLSGFSSGAAGGIGYSLALGYAEGISPVELEGDLEVLMGFSLVSVYANLGSGLFCVVSNTKVSSSPDLSTHREKARDIMIAAGILDASVGVFSLVSGIHSSRMINQVDKDQYSQFHTTLRGFASVSYLLGATNILLTVVDFILAAKLQKRLEKHTSFKSPEREHGIVISPNGLGLAGLFW